jgi:hypothetical protein
MLNQVKERKKSISNKLSPEDRALLWMVYEDRIKLIKQLDAISNQALADKMDVDVSTIDNLFSGRTYSNEYLAYSQILNGNAAVEARR